MRKTHRPAIRRSRRESRAGLHDTFPALAYSASMTGTVSIGPRIASSAAYCAIDFAFERGLALQLDQRLNHASGPSV